MCDDARMYYGKKITVGDLVTLVKVNIEICKQFGH